jgi:hypothetical protein
MSYGKFFDLIEHTPLGDFFVRKAKIVAETDPYRIYVENVRSFFGIPTKLARLICELAVRQDALIRRFAYYCPNKENHRIVIVTDVPLAKDAKLHCELCELSGESKSEFNAVDCKEETVYALTDADG